MKLDSSGFVRCGIRVVMVNRSVQIQTPAGLIHADSARRAHAYGLASELISIKSFSNRFSRLRPTNVCLDVGFHSPGLNPEDARNFPATISFF